MITSIGHLAFHITDLNRSLDFYCTKLGFREAFRLDREGTPSPWIVYIQVTPGQFIELFPGATLADSPAAEGLSYHHLALTVDDMEATLRDLGARGIPTPGSPTQGVDGNWQYWLADPDGNRIELMQIMPASPHAAADASWPG
ncbi:MAG TPA: VOC family protein [Chloroflexota bacterium]|nr:VOC family protein [Chloroflexota bacterium]